MEIITTILSYVWTGFLVALLFGVTIFVHELGHFLMARRLGLVVDTFSIGFGHAIWKKKRKSITYKIGWMPFGGYVALPQLDPELGVPKEGEPKRDLPPISPWRKIPVLLAGVTGNILLAFLLAVIIYFSGPGGAGGADDCTVGYVSTNSAAWRAGLRPDDCIVAVNDQPVKTWDAFMINAALTPQATITVASAHGDTRDLVVETEKLPQGGRLVMGVIKQSPVEVINVRPGGPAAEAGMQSGDVILEMAGIPMTGSAVLLNTVDAYRDREIPVVVRRDGQTMTLQVTPAYDAAADRALIGIEFDPLDMGGDIYRTPWDQMVRWAAPVFRILKAFMTPSEAKHAAQAVGGPAMIIQSIWISLRTSLLYALWLMGLINVNLAILNLLPIPILDGGHIVFSVIEGVARRRLPPRVMVLLYNVFAVLLIGLMLLITYRDIVRMVPSGMRDKTGADVATNNTTGVTASEMETGQPHPAAVE